VVVGVDYSADMDQTRAAIEAAAATFAAKTIQGDGRGSTVVLSKLGASSVDWKVRMWVAADDYWSLLESLTCEVKRQLDAAKIGIPFPQLDVHLSHFTDADIGQAQR
jgi:small conductance mechanosensitive channel